MSAIIPTPAPVLLPVPVRTALLSVSDKAGIVDLARALAARGVRILSTGGTFQTLEKAGIAVEEVAAYTGFPEMMDGRVKTLHPRVHGGILARRDLETHRAAMQENGIEGIDLVVVNLYPFAATVAGGGDFATCIENIDIGGPAMIRSAAKNHAFVTILTDPRDYDAFIAELNEGDGAIGIAMRRRLAAAAFAHTALYDSQVARWFATQEGQPLWPERIGFTGRLATALRYGENPHQNAALYIDGSGRPGVATARLVQGKELSYNNLNDTDAAFEVVAEFDAPAIAIIKHANPCGVATAVAEGEAMTAIYHRALACDPVSAFGGIIALNRILDAATAAEILKIFCEVIIAPGIDAAALPLLAKKPNVRVLSTDALPNPSESRLTIRSIAGGFLVQDADTGRVMSEDLKVVTKSARQRKKSWPTSCSPSASPSMSNPTPLSTPRTVPRPASAPAR